MLLNCVKNSLNKTSFFFLHPMPNSPTATLPSSSYQAVTIVISYTCGIQGNLDFFFKPPEANLWNIISWQVINTQKQAAWHWLKPVEPLQPCILQIEVGLQRQGGTKGRGTSYHYTYRKVKKKAWKLYRRSFKILLKLKSNISFKLARLPYKCDCSVFQSLLPLGLNQLTDFSWNWWSNSLSIMKLDNLIEVRDVVWAAVLPPDQPGSNAFCLLGRWNEKEIRGEEGRGRRNGGEGWMCERSGGIAGLAEVGARCAERAQTNREPRHHQFQCSQ